MKSRYYINSAGPTYDAIESDIYKIYNNIKLLLYHKIK
jgi:hypothetical protein